MATSCKYGFYALTKVVFVPATLQFRSPYSFHIPSTRTVYDLVLLLPSINLYNWVLVQLLSFMLIIARYCISNFHLGISHMIISTCDSAGGAVPALAQLASSSYHAALSSTSMPPASQDDKMHKSRTSSPL